MSPYFFLYLFMSHKGYTYVELHNVPLAVCTIYDTPCKITNTY
jgi:hypothetical protein